MHPVHHDHAAECHFDFHFIRCPGIILCILWSWNWSNLDGVRWLHWTRNSFGQLHPFHPLLLTLWGCWCPLSRYSISLCICGSTILCVRIIKWQQYCTLCQKLEVALLRERFVWKVGQHPERAEWRCALEECGEQYVIMVGAILMLVWSADNLVIRH